MLDKIRKRHEDNLDKMFNEIFNFKWLAELLKNERKILTDDLNKIKSDN